MDLKMQSVDDHLRTTTNAMIIYITVAALIVINLFNFCNGAWDPMVPPNLIRRRMDGPERYPYPFYIEANDTHTGSFIFLHGLAANGHAWYPELYYMRKSYMRMIMPTARRMVVPAIRDNIFPAWFTYYGFNIKEDANGIKKATKYVHELIDAELKRGVKSTNVILGGYNQGGALALYAAFTYPKKLGGVMSISAWLPMIKNMTEEYGNTVNRNIPILQCHGDDDEIIPYKSTGVTNCALHKLTDNVIFKTYCGINHHEWCKQQLQDMEKFLVDNIEKPANYTEPV